jgi:hypothetical protein
MRRQMAELFTQDDVVRALRMECQIVGGEQAWADLHGIPARYVHEVLAGTRPIGLSIATYLGFRKVDRWQEIHPDA